MNRLRMAIFRLNCTLQHPANWIGYASDPAVTERLIFWLRVRSRTLYWAPPFMFRTHTFRRP